MNAGLTVYNDSNTLQIDDNFFNLVLQAKYVVQFNIAPSGVYTVWRGTITVQGDNPVPVIYSSTNWVCLSSAQRNNTLNTTTFTFFSSSSGTADLLIYDNPQGGSGTFGLQTFNSNGELTYDSSRPYLDIATSSTVSSVYSYGNIRTISVIDAQNVGIMIPQFYGVSYKYIDYPEVGTVARGELWIEGLFCRKSGNVAQFLATRIGSSTVFETFGDEWYIENISGTIMILNVKGNP